MVSASLRAFLDSRLPRYLEELADLVAIDSPSSHREGTEEVGRWFAERYRALGAEVAFEPGALAGMRAPLEPPGNVARHLLATFRGKGGGRLLLLGHMDTVFPVGEAAKRPFRVEGGRAYGPGVADMKGCLLAALYALEGLLASGFGSFGEILLLYDSDEEVGNPSSRPLIEKLAAGCDAVLVLESARSDGSLVSARKGNSLFRLEVEGVAAHAGVEPEKGRSAVLELAHKVVAAHAIARAGSGGPRVGPPSGPGRFARSPEPPSITGDSEELALSLRPGSTDFDELSRIELAKVGGRGTVNVTRLSGGARPFIVPPEAAATVEFRAYSPAELARMEGELRALAGRTYVQGTRTRLTHLGGRPAMERSEGTARLVALAQEVARAGGFEVAESATGGTSDGNYTAALGVPTLDGLGPVGGNLHREDEYLEVPSVPERAWLLGEMVRRLGEGGTFNR